MRPLPHPSLVGERTHLFIFFIRTELTSEIQLVLTLPLLMDAYED